MMGYEFEPIKPESDSNVMRGDASGEEIARLEVEWKKLWGKQASEIRADNNALPNSRNLTPLDVFVDETMGGKYPTPEIILAIAKAFKLYFLGAGELSLEEVFFGSPQKRAGSQAMQSRRDQRFLFFHDTIIRSGGSDKVNLGDLADNFIDAENYANNRKQRGHDDAATFLQGYRRWKKKNFPDK